MASRDDARERRRVRAPTRRVAVTAVFFLSGVVFISWYARLPAAIIGFAVMG